jgi:hypothetical protein
MLNFFFNKGGLKLKGVSGFKTYYIVLIVSMIACAMLLASCFGDSNSDSSSNSNTQAITPIGVPSTCLTVHPPVLVKLTDGQYKLIEEINNCGGKVAGPLDVTAQIAMGKTTQKANLVGPATIVANSKAIYSSSGGQKNEMSKELHFIAPVSSSALVTVLVTMKGSVQGEWDGQVTVPI